MDLLDQMDEARRRQDLNAYMESLSEDHKLTQLQSQMLLNELESSDHDDSSPIPGMDLIPSSEPQSTALPLSPTGARPAATSKFASSRPEYQALTLLSKEDGETVRRLMNELHQQQTENQALIFRVNHLQIQNDALFNSDQKHKLNLDQALFVIATLEQDKLLLETKLKDIAGFEHQRNYGHLMEEVRGQLLQVSNAKCQELMLTMEQMRRETESSARSYEQQLTALEQDNQALSLKLEALSTEIAQRAVLYAAQERRMTDTYATQEFKVQGQAKELVEVTAKLEQLQAMYHQLQQEHVKLTMQHRTSQRTHEDSTLHIEELQEQLQQANEDLAAMAAHNQSLETMVSNLRGSDAEGMEMNVLQEIDRIRQQARVREESLRIQINEAREQISSVSWTRDVYAQQVTALTQENQEMRHLLYELEAMGLTKGRPMMSSDGPMEANVSSIPSNMTMESLLLGTSREDDDEHGGPSEDDDNGDNNEERGIGEDSKHNRHAKQDAVNGKGTRPLVRNSIDDGTVSSWDDDTASLAWLVDTAAGGVDPATNSTTTSRTQQLPVASLLTLLQAVGQTVHTSEDPTHLRQQLRPILQQYCAVPTTSANTDAAPNVDNLSSAVETLVQRFVQLLTHRIAVTEDAMSISSDYETRLRGMQKENKRLKHVIRRILARAAETGVLLATSTGSASLSGPSDTAAAAVVSAALQDQLDVLRTENQQLQDHVRSYRQEIDELQEMMLTQKALGRHETLLEVDARVHTAEVNALAAQQQWSTLQQTHADCQRERDQWQAQCDTLQRQHETLVLTQQSLQLERDVAQKRWQEVVEERDTAVTEYEELVRRHEALVARMSQSTIVTAALMRPVHHERESQTETVTMTPSAAQTNEPASLIPMETQTDHHSSMPIETQTETARVEANETQTERETATDARATTTTAPIETQTEDLPAETSTPLEPVDTALVESHELLQRAYAALVDETQMLQRLVSDRTSDYDSLRVQYQESREALVSLQEQHQATQEALKTLEDIKTRLMAELATAQSERDAATQQWQQVEAQLATVEADHSHTLTRYEETHHQWHETQSRLTETQLLLDTTQAQLVTTRTRLLDTEAALHDVEANRRAGVEEAIQVTLLSPETQQALEDQLRVLQHEVAVSQTRATQWETKQRDTETQWTTAQSTIATLADRLDALQATYAQQDTHVLRHLRMLEARLRECLHSCAQETDAAEDAAGLQGHRDEPPANSPAREPTATRQISNDGNEEDDVTTANVPQRIQQATSMAMDIATELATLRQRHRTRHRAWTQQLTHRDATIQQLRAQVQHQRKTHAEELRRVAAALHSHHHSDDADVVDAKASTFEVDGDEEHNQAIRAVFAAFEQERETKEEMQEYFTREMQRIRTHVATLQASYEAQMQRIVHQVDGGAATHETAAAAAENDRIRPPRVAEAKSVAVNGGGGLSSTVAGETTQLLSPSRLAKLGLDVASVVDTKDSATVAESVSVSDSSIAAGAKDAKRGAVSDSGRRRDAKGGRVAAAGAKVAASIDSIAAQDTYENDHTDDDAMVEQASLGGRDTDTHSYISPASSSSSSASSSVASSSMAAAFSSVPVVSTDEAKAQYVSLVREFQALQEETAEERHRWHAQYATLQETHATLQETHTTLQEAYAGLQTTHAALTKQHHALQETYTALEETYTALSTDFTALQRRYETLRRELDAKRLRVRHEGVNTDVTTSSPQEWTTVRSLVYSVPPHPVRPSSSSSSPPRSPPPTNSAALTTAATATLSPPTPTTPSVATNLLTVEDVRATLALQKQRIREKYAKRLVVAQQQHVQETQQLREAFAHEKAWILQTVRLECQEIVAETQRLLLAKRELAAHQAQVHEIIAELSQRSLFAPPPHTTSAMTTTASVPTNGPRHATASSSSFAPSSGMPGSTHSSGDWSTSMAPPPPPQAPPASSSRGATSAAPPMTMATPQRADTSAQWGSASSSSFLSATPSLYSTSPLMQRATAPGANGLTHPTVSASVAMAASQPLRPFPSIPAAVGAASTASVPPQPPQPTAATAAAAVTSPSSSTSGASFLSSIAPQQHSPSVSSSSTHANNPHGPPATAAVRHPPYVVGGSAPSSSSSRNTAAAVAGSVAPVAVPAGGPSPHATPQRPRQAPPSSSQQTPLPGPSSGSDGAGVLYPEMLSPAVTRALVQQVYDRALAAEDDPYRSLHLHSTAAATAPTTTATKTTSAMTAAVTSSSVSSALSPSWRHK